jgi:hypothetical protein
MTDASTTTIMQLGMMDASNGEPFAPEMYTINHFNMVAYTEGFLFISPDNESAQKFILAGVGNNSRDRNPWQFSECGPDDEDWQNEPGYAEARQYPR